jgi:Flp pilus assembly protein TadG
MSLLKVKILRRERKAVAAIEFAVVISFIVGLVAPMADIVIAINTYLSTYQSLSAAAAYGTYHPPQDITNMTVDNWPTTIQSLFSGSSKSATVLCGNPGTTCTATSSPLPRYFVLSTTIVPNSSPIVLSTLSSPQTVTYAGRFQ